MMDYLTVNQNGQSSLAPFEVSCLLIFLLNYNYLLFVGQLLFALSFYCDDNALGMILFAGFFVSRY